MEQLPPGCDDRRMELGIELFGTKVAPRVRNALAPVPVQGSGER